MEKSELDVLAESELHAGETVIQLHFENYNVIGELQDSIEPMVG
jgi:hypothetical protein